MMIEVGQEYYSLTIEMQSECCTIEYSLDISMQLHKQSHKHVAK